MWFEAVSSSSAGKDGPLSIGYAESNDGITWLIKGPGGEGVTAGAVFGPAGGAVFDAHSVGYPSVVHDPGDAAAPWKLWYEAGNRAVDVQNSLGYATSGNGLIWTRSSLPILNPSSDARIPLSIDSGDIKHPCAYIDTSLPANTKSHFLL